MTDDPQADLDPIEFVRAVLHIAPEDAAEIRERSPATRPRRTRSADHAEQGADNHSKD